MNERVVVVENGERTTVTKLVAILKQIVNKSTGGDMKAIKLLTSLLAKYADSIMNPVPVVIISGADARL